MYINSRSIALTAYNNGLIHITPSILIYANALGYILSIKVKCVIQNTMPMYLCVLYIERGSQKYNFQKIEKDIKLSLP